jgi:2-dehydro-3-deoxygalactonokinase
LFNGVENVVSAEIQLDDGIAKTHLHWIDADKPESDKIQFYRKKLGIFIKQLPGEIDTNLPVFISGMASSSIGLKELPYQKFPFTWNVSQFIVERIDADEDFSHTLYLISGFQTNDDIMRGEETILLGCDLADADEKIFIFPGTHSKHVVVANRKGLYFKTYMTGELFNLLAEKSILSDKPGKEMDEKSFTEGVRSGINGNLLNTLFNIRVRKLIHRVSPSGNYQYLSGLLIGAELKELKDTDCSIYLVCNQQLKHAYLLALELSGIKGEIHYLNADEMLVKGQCRIANHFL